MFWVVINIKKICSKCGILKTVENFEKRTDSKDGYRQYCRECKKKQSKVAYDKRLNNDRMTFWKTRADSLNKASARKGVAKTIIQNSPKISYIDLYRLYEKNEFCHYCKVKLPKEDIVFDHKIPLSRNGLHSIDNIAICCRDCNSLKGTRTDVEFQNFISEYINRFS